MTSAEVRKKYLEFFEKRGHKIIPSASLVPENDPTTLFTGSGMQPLVPFLLGQPHPAGKRLTDSQKSFRSGDIDDIGDNRHTTFFEMLGNWSLGDYFKQEQLSWFFEFLTKEIGIDPNKLFVTVFAGDQKARVERDNESVEIWKKLFQEKGIEAKDVELLTEENGSKVGMQGGKIFYYDAKKNWWSRSGVPENMPEGEPGGPDSEVFYEFEHIEHDKKFGEHCHPNCDCGRFLEIGNSVFMEFVRTKNGFEKLPQRNVDFGGGLERITAVSENKSDVFQIDVFQNIISELERLSGKKYSDPAYTAAFRIVADHLRSSVFLIGDGVSPGNTERNYFVRRLLRRAVRYADKIGIGESGLSKLVLPLLEHYKEAYPETYKQASRIENEIKNEEEKFRKTLEKGMGELNTILNVLNGREKVLGMNDERLSGFDAFNLYQTYGFPIEITVEICKENGFGVDIEDYKKRLEAHQELSRSGSEQKFKGGLGDTSEMSVKYHTATHLLHKALREVLGDHVEQKGSNITPERLRFDFSHPQKMTDAEKQRVEEIVNEKIKENLPVKNIILPKAEAEKIGAMHLFGEKYGDQVSVYYIGDSLETAYSKEFCGGPHVEQTGDLASLRDPEESSTRDENKKRQFKILKEEAVAQGIRRIKAILE